MNRRELIALLVAAIPGVAWLRSFRPRPPWWRDHIAIISSSSLVSNRIGTITAIDRAAGPTITVEWSR